MNWSRTKTDKLGERLRNSDQPQQADLDLLDEIRALYVAPMRFVAERLLEAGFSPTTRPEKTWQSTVEKLKRETVRLSQVRDIAGARVVVDGGRRLQDNAVDRICILFPNHKKIDRRERPMHGYRAVHLEADINRFFVEIQVRTSLQDQWAQVNEKFGDMFGRGIRYGEPPDEPDRELAPGVTPMSIIQIIQSVSDVLATLEEVELEAEQIEVDGTEWIMQAELEPDEMVAVAEQLILDDRIPSSKAILFGNLDRLRGLLELIERRIL